MNLFEAALKRENTGRPPVWFMRQAGRYHSHYQALRKRYSFIDLCKIPEVACETTMGPIRDFDFDAAILFSDLLFPLEAMGMPLTYEPGPTLAWHLSRTEDLKKLREGDLAALQFQADAMKLNRTELPKSKGLLGFVGGPLTLYSYAVEGKHSGGLLSAKAGLKDGRYAGFCELLIELLARNMALQAKAGADVIAVLDTCAGEFDPKTYQEEALPTLRKLFARYRELSPDVPALYYSKGTGPAHWNALQGLPIAGIGIDWNHDLSKVLPEYGTRWAVQGNFDPEWLFLPACELEVKIREFLLRVKAVPLELRKGWICGLGHGVLQKTPEESVKLFVRLQKEIFA